VSEYQYYEFFAQDRPLSASQMEEVDAISSRAEVTPTSFTVVYNYSDLRVDPIKLLERHFDVFVYVANWGTHWFAFRLPLGVVEPSILDRYLTGEKVTVKKTKEHLLIEIRSEDEMGGDWEEGEGWMARLAPVRTEILSGDLRALYLVWLLSVQEAYEEELDPGELEPPVPPGLAGLSGPLQDLCEFLRIDEHLVGAAGEASAKEEDARTGFAAWLSDLPEEEKDQLLLEVVDGKGGTIGPDLIRRFRAAGRRDRSEAQQPRRTVGELLEAAGRQRQEAERKRREHLAAERKRREARARAAKKKRLDALEGNEEAAWQKVESLASSKKQPAYDEAVVMLHDLRDLAARQESSGLFASRLEALRRAHARKYSFIKRLDKAGLP
jgi:hypothetical protein